MNNPLLIMIKLIKFTILLNILFFNISWATPDESNNKLSLISLTADEYAFIKTHPVIRISNDIGWPPFDFFENGLAQGYSVELMQIIAERIGIKFEFVQGNYEELIDLLCNRQIDVMHATDKADKLRQCANFSDPYEHESAQFLTRKDLKNINSLQDLFGYTIATPKSYEQTALIKNKYADKIKIVETENILEAINLVNSGKADFTADYTSVLNYYIKKLDINNINKENIYRFFHTYISEDILLLPNFTYNWIYNENFLKKEIYINRNKYCLKDIILNKKLIIEYQEIIIEKFLEELPNLLKIKLKIKDQIEKIILKRQISQILVYS